MNHTLITVFGIGFIFLMTSLGSALAYCFRKELSPKANAVFLGFASGIMLAASVWSLLLPAIEQAEELWGKFALFPVATGFILGGVFLLIFVKLAPLLRKGNGSFCEHGSLKSSAKLFLAVSLHNVPEGLAVGFAFGVASAIGTTAAYLTALGLAIGIGVQNFPEGAAVSLPLRSELGNKHKAFFYGVFSGVAEPIFAVIGYFLAAYIRSIQPWLLAFSAGAMIFVVAEDLIPAAKSEDSFPLGAWGVMLGFAVMMLLDVALG